MPHFDPSRLAADCGGEWRGLPAAPIAGVSIDTRTLARGEMFVALRTQKRDGHFFLADAAAAGASAALVSRHVPDSPLPQLVVPDALHALHAIARAHRRRFSGAVVGVTGSAGKTSTKDLLALLLGETGDVLATEGNLNNHLGVPLTLLRVDSARHRCVVAEAGISGPGEMDVIAELISPDIAVITTVSAAHLDGLRTVENVAREKARLAAHLAREGVAVFPVHCLEFTAFRELNVRAYVALPAGSRRVELPPAAHVVSYAIAHDEEGTALCVTWEGELQEFRLRRVTAGMAGNAALAIATALHLGVSADLVRARLPKWRPAALRGEIRRGDGRFIYLDCYNANPASMADALEGFLGMVPTEAPRLFVVGSMEELGGEAAALHRAAGERWPALRAGDRLIVFGTHATALAEGVRRATPGAEVWENPDRGSAARTLREFRGAVFVKGSRRYELETLLDDAASGAHQPQTHHHDRGEAAA